MPLLNQDTSAEMRFTELRRTGAGSLVPTGTFFEFTGEQHSSMQGELDMELQAKVARKEMPGTDQVVHHAMSSTWQPFEISGEWDDKWMGSGNAWQTFLEFSKFVGRMPLVRLVIDAISFVGIVTNLKIRYRTHTKIMWSVKLSPEENETVGSFRQRTPTPPLQKTVPQWLSEAGEHASLMAEFQSGLSTVPISTEDLIGSVSRLAEIQDALDRISLQSLDLDVVNQLLLMATNFRRLRQSAFAASENVRHLRPDLAVAFDDFLHELGYAAWVHGSSSSSTRLIGTSRRAEIDLRSRARTRPRAIYRPKPGESLEHISMKFYGTPNNARLIYETNHLSTLSLDGTEELIIPERGA